ncbi:MAG: hypothetical protein RI565_04735 [Schleiferiaceae bacterium]|nr:hypothetical protein [Schleiferiaceae bacterium]
MPLEFKTGEQWDASRLQEWKSWVKAPAQKAFLDRHQDADIPPLMLRYSGAADKQLLLSQIAAHQQIRKKLPSWYARWNLMLPARMHLEQASSEAMARLKAQIIDPAGAALVDLTGGTGVDFWQLSQRARSARLVEPHAPLARLTQHNLAELGQEAPTEIMTAEEWLERDTGSADLLFLDPSRRKNGQRQLHLEDYAPRLTEWEEVLVQKGSRVWAKLSPLLDLRWLSETLRYLQSIHVLAYRNECKELLVELREKPAPLSYHAWHLDGQEVLHHFASPERGASALYYGEPETYLYEPNAALRKARLGDQMAQQYDLAKLHPNSQLYTAAKAYPDYPGRMWEVIKQHKPGGKDLRGARLNVVSRNYPLRADQISQKWKLKPHRNRFLLATQTRERKYWLEAIWRNGPPETN